jgi:hypothetical protein
MSEKDFYTHAENLSPGEINSAEEQCSAGFNWGYSDTEVIGPPGFLLPLLPWEVEHEDNHVNQGRRCQLKIDGTFLNRKKIARSTMLRKCVVSLSGHRA